MNTLPSLGYEFGPYRLDVTGRTLECCGEVVALPPKAVEVLAELVKRSGEVVEKRVLMEVVWPQAFVEEANLNQMIFLLRRALNANGEGEYITTVPRRGYRFSGAVRAVKIHCRFDSLAVLPFAKPERRFERGIFRRRDNRGFNRRTVEDRQLTSRFTNIHNAVQRQGRADRANCQSVASASDCRRLGSESRRPVANYRAADSRRK